jgi:hypothetical protein
LLSEIASFIPCPPEVQWQFATIGRGKPTRHCAGHREPTTHPHRYGMRFVSDRYPSDERKCLGGAALDFSCTEGDKRYVQRRNKGRFSSDQTAGLLPPLAQ